MSYCIFCGKTAKEIDCILMPVTGVTTIGVQVFNGQFECFPKCGAYLSEEEKRDIAMEEVEELRSMGN